MQKQRNKHTYAATFRDKNITTNAAFFSANFRNFSCALPAICECVLLSPVHSAAIPLHSTQSLIFWKCSELGDWQETGYRWVELSRTVRVFIAPEALLTLLRSDLTQLNWSVQLSWVALCASSRALRSGQARDRRLLYGNERSAGRFIASNRTTRPDSQSQRPGSQSVTSGHAPFVVINRDWPRPLRVLLVCVCVCVCYTCSRSSVSK